MRPRAASLVAALLGTLVGLGAYTFRYAEGLSHFSTDPRACANCHIMRESYDSWQKASHHAAATSAECHLATAFGAQGRTERLMGLAENALLALMDAVQAATARGVRPEALGDARAFHRKAQWRLDFVAAENSKGFHAPQEAAPILGEAIDFARQGQAAALTAAR